eukprot:jgi/Bigna1/127555/aug1.4_g2263
MHLKLLHTQIRRAAGIALKWKVCLMRTTDASNPTDGIIKIPFRVKVRAFEIDWPSDNAAFGSEKRRLELECSPTKGDGEAKTIQLRQPASIPTSSRPACVSFYYLPNDFWLICPWPNRRMMD